MSQVTYWQWSVYCVLMCRQALTEFRLGYVSTSARAFICRLHFYVISLYFVHSRIVLSSIYYSFIQAYLYIHMWICWHTHLAPSVFEILSTLLCRYSQCNTHMQYSLHMAQGDWSIGPYVLHVEHVTLYSDLYYNIAQLPLLHMAVTHKY
jgi:hypothetical protein